jgi:hypothetical protein
MSIIAGYASAGPRYFSGRGLPDVVLRKRGRYGRGNPRKAADGNAAEEPKLVGVAQGEKVCCRRIFGPAVC